jgi:hypothetical protein
MSDDNNVVVETTEEVKQTEKAKAMRRRSSIGRFFDGVKSLLGFSTGEIINDDTDDKEGEETEVKEEVAVPEDQMDVEVEVSAEDEDPEIDSIGDEDQDFFLDEGEEVKPDPKLQAIKKNMNLTKREKITLAKQRSEELLEEDIRRASQEEGSSSASPERKATKRRPGRPPKKTPGKKAAAKTSSKTSTKKITKSPSRSRSSSPAKSPSSSRSASPAKKTPAKKAATKTPKKTVANLAKSPAKSPTKSPKTPRSTRKTPAKVKAAATKATPRTVGRKRKAEDPAEGESPTKKVKVERRKSAPANPKKQESKPDVTVTWPKNVLRQTYKGGKTFYGSVTVNNKKFSIGDTIYLISETSNEPYIGIIESLYETKTGRNRAELQWYYKHEETNSTAKPTKGEVYQSDHIDANPIESFVFDRTPIVKHERAIKDLSAYLAKPDHYYYNRFYDHEAKKFRNAKYEK